MRSPLALALAVVLSSACGSEAAAPPTHAEPVVDRSPAERPAGTLVELSLDGGDEAMSALIAPLPPSAPRAVLPSRVATFVDGLIETPTEIRTRVSSRSPIRLLMARIDGQTRSALALRLETPLAPSERHGGGPRGSDRIGDRAAVDELVAVVSDDADMLERSFGYLAYGALARPSEEGVVVLSVPAGTLATTLRTGLEQMVSDQRARLLASAAAARAAHDRPPDFGDPEAVVTSVADALLARLAYLPDLGDATVTLRPTASGLALAMEADVTRGSPLAAALAEGVAVAPALAAAMPSSSALVVATGTSAPARTAHAGDLAAWLASIGGPRVSAAERAALESASADVAALRGDEGAIALGASESGAPFVLGLTRGGTDAAAPTPWGRALPWMSQVLGALGGCAPTSPRPSASGATICGDLALATRRVEAARADAIGRDAPALAEAAATALAHETPTTSPDLMRDLAGLPHAPFALVLARPLRALPLLAAFGGASRGLPRGDGAAVLAFAADGDHLQIVLRASTSAMADLEALWRLFAEESDSE